MKPVNVADVRRMARRRLPRIVFDYIDGGAEEEVTLRDNEGAFQEVKFRPRHAVGTEHGKLNAAVLGNTLSMPLVLAPCGFTRLVHPDGELAAARAAAKVGVGYTLSTMSNYSIEDVARVGEPGSTWYQLYLIGGRTVAERAIERAKAARFSALVVTIDTATPGMRERDLRNGAHVLMGSNKLAMIPFLPRLLAHPIWLAAYLRDGGVATFPNIVGQNQEPLALREAREALVQCAVTWKDLSWIRQTWPGPIVIKGILTGEDARRALDEGAAAIIVSNHGGRQLDGVPATLRVLPEIVCAVNRRAEVLMDGGIRRGGDLLKAICLGASAVLVGRPYMYGLGAGGERGVLKVLEVLRADLQRTMALLGCSSIAELNQSFIDYRGRRKIG